MLRDGFVLLAGMPTEPGAVLAVAETLGVVRETEHGRVAEIRVGAVAPVRGVHQPADAPLARPPRSGIRC